MLAWLDSDETTEEGHVFCAKCDNQLCGTNSFCTRCGTRVSSQKRQPLAKQQSWVSRLWNWLQQAIMLTLQQHRFEQREYREQKL
jgi:predicted amidophosphoribosyltransferase